MQGLGHVRRQLCSTPTRLVLPPPPAPFENRPTASSSSFGADLGPDPAPRPEGSLELLPVPSPTAHPSPIPSRAMSYRTHLTRHLMKVKTNGRRALRAEGSISLGKVLIKHILGGLVLAFCLLG